MAETRVEVERWTLAEWVAVEGMIREVLEDVDESEIGYPDAAALIHRAFAEVGKPVLPASSLSALIEKLDERTRELWTDEYGPPAALSRSRSQGVTEAADRLRSLLEPVSS